MPDGETARFLELALEQYVITTQKLMTSVSVPTMKLTNLECSYGENKRHKEKKTIHALRQISSFHLLSGLPGSGVYHKVMTEKVFG